METKKARKPARKPSPPRLTVAPDEREFVLKFDGRPREISAATFLESLSGITSIVQEANHELGTGEPLDIKIRAPKPGSFIVHLLLDPAKTAHIANLFGISGGIIGALAAAIQLWRFLKGEPAKSIEDKPENTVEIQNAAGQVAIHDKKIANFVITNSTVTFNLARTFGALDGDPNVTGLQVLDKEQRHKLAEVPRDEFAVLAIAPPPAQDQKRDITVRTPVNIVKPSFDPKLRWEIVYNGNRIGAIVTDKRFHDEIDRGKKFSKGDTLDVSLRMRQEYDPALKTYLNKGYEITAVHHHIPGAQQDALFPA